MRRIQRTLFWTAGVVSITQLLSGCGHNNFGGDNRPIQLDDSNGRVAYLATEADSGEASFNSTAKQVGASSAVLTADGATATLTTPQTDEISDLAGLPRDTNNPGQERYTNLASAPGGFQGGNILVQRIADVDQNGTPDDTFLTMNQNIPVRGARRTEFSASYAGTRTDAAVMNQLNSRVRSATYHGTGNVRGGQGALPLSLTGALTMDASFGGGALSQNQISGRIDISPASASNPSGFDQLTFNGQTLGTSADYGIGGLALKRGGTTMVNFDRSAGVGSFFGDRAGGTIGVFSGTGKTTDANPSNVNIVGSFTGSTTDNNAP